MPYILQINYEDRIIFNTKFKISGISKIPEKCYLAMILYAVKNSAYYIYIILEYAVKAFEQCKEGLQNTVTRSQRGKFPYLSCVTNLRLG